MLNSSNGEYILFAMFHQRQCVACWPCWRAMIVVARCVMRGPVLGLLRLSGGETVSVCVRPPREPLWGRSHLARGDVGLSGLSFSEVSPPAASRHTIRYYLTCTASGLQILPIGRGFDGFTSGCWTVMFFSRTVFLFRNENEWKEMFIFLRALSYFNILLIFNATKCINFFLLN